MQRPDHTRVGCEPSCEVDLSEMRAIYFELAQGSSIRLCLQLEETFPDLRGWQLELMKLLCLVAYNSEIYDGVGEDSWLRTTVSLPEACIFSAGSREHVLMDRIAAHGGIAAAFQRERITADAFHTYWTALLNLHRELAARIRIHSNILPRTAYRENFLQGLLRRRPGPFSWVMFRRAFFPACILAEAVAEAKSAAQKTEEWRMNGGQCVLAMHLQSRHFAHASQRESLRSVDKTQVCRSEKTLGINVREVTWRNGIYALKSFYVEYTKLFEREIDVALRVSHTHVVHPIGQFVDEEGKPSLLMEMLGNNLYKSCVENDQKHRKAALVLRPVDALDVLLQIAKGLQSLHDAKLIHGDLKLANVFFSHFEIFEDVHHFLVKIGDFDRAQFVSSPGAFIPNSGSTMYAAPEVLKWTVLKEHESPFCVPANLDTILKLDVYSFGSIAYEVLTGRPVYNGKVGLIKPDEVKLVVQGKWTPHGSQNTGSCSEKLRIYFAWQWIRWKYPHGLVHCVERCWALNPSDRPSSSDLCEELQRFKSEMQRLERGDAYVLWGFLVPCLLALICHFVIRMIDFSTL